MVLFSKVNPTDLPLSGIDGRDLSQNPVWWEGLLFLKYPSAEWPKQDKIEESVRDNSQALIEKVKYEPKITHVLVSVQRPNIDNVINFEWFSCQGKLVHVLAWVLRFVSNLKSKLHKETVFREIQVTTSEIANAELALICSIQYEYFSKEIDYLNSKRATKPPVYVTQFNFFIDKNGILRCSSQIKHSSVIESGKKPILLPKRNYYSKLIVDAFHVNILHNRIRVLRQQKGGKRAANNSDIRLLQFIATKGV